jgi:hypothetical protein
VEALAAIAEAKKKKQEGKTRDESGDAGGGRRRRKDAISLEIGAYVGMLSALVADVATRPVEP